MFGPPRPTVRSECERDATGLRPLLREDEEILFECGDVTFGFAPEEVEGEGALFITSQRVLWLSASDSSKAFDFDVPYICLHAVSRDPQTFPVPCIYCQLDEPEEDVLREAYFAPRQESQLEPLFAALSRAAELNPDPPEPGGEEYSDDDDGGGGGEEEEVLDGVEAVNGNGLEGDFDGLIVDEAQLAGLGEAELSALDRLESVLAIAPGVQGQFEDAAQEGGAASASTTGAPAQDEPPPPR